MNQNEISSMKYHSKVTNTSCGLILACPTRVVFGCGRKPNDEEFSYYWYQIDGYKGLFSTVTLCPQCETEMEGNVIKMNAYRKKEEKKEENQADAQVYNLEIEREKRVKRREHAERDKRRRNGSEE